MGDATIESDMDRPLTIAEVFGPTVQGEGPSTGRLASFVRLGRCNLDCAWCDTPYTWDWKGKNGVRYDPSAELSERTVDDVAAHVTSLGAPLIVITGGEPLLQRTQLSALVSMLTTSCHVEIETNGTRPPLEVAGVRYNVSPKLPSSGVDPRRGLIPDAICALRECPATAWKFVVSDEVDLAAADAFVHRYDLDPSDVWVMPEGRTAMEIIAGLHWLADEAIARRYNVSGRLHVLAWGDERGR